MRAVPVALFLFALPFAGLFSACSGEVTADQDFVNLYVELRLAEMTYGKDSPMARLVRQDALKAAGYTREEFFAKTDAILEDEKQWVPFQKAVTERIDSLLAPPKPVAEAKPVSKSPNSPEVRKRMLETMKNMPARKGGGER